MEDVSQGCGKPVINFSRILSVFNPFQLADVLSPYTVSPSGEYVFFTPRGLMKAAFSTMQQSTEMCSKVIPGRDNRLGWQELTNKLQAFELFEHVDVVLGLPAGGRVALPRLIDKVHALGPYRAIWGMEGVGHYYAEMVWEHQGIPRQLLSTDNVGIVPPNSLIPLHTGMGMSFAEHLLKNVSPHRTDADISSMLQQFVELCQSNSREGYVGAALEALGLVTRLLYPHMVRRIDQQLLKMVPDVMGYFWHGVGRSLYFLPMNALPCLNWFWHVVEMPAEEAPHTLACLNTLAGLAWAITLVNIRHPQILENVLRRHHHLLCENDAFANGVSAAVLIGYDMKPDDPYIRVFCQYQPDPCERRLTQIWNRQVQRPCQEALQHHHGILKTHGALGELFRYQPIEALADRLNRASQP